MKSYDLYTLIDLVYSGYHPHLWAIEILKIFSKNSEDVGMAQKVDKQERDVTR